LRSHFISPTVTRKKLAVPKTRKCRKSLPSEPSPSLINLILNNAGIALPTPVIRNVLQTQINMLAWALGAGREANHIKLTDYYNTDKEDIYE